MSAIKRNSHHKFRKTTILLLNTFAIPVRIFRLVHIFAADLLDRSAKPKPLAETQDLWAIAFAALSGIASGLDSVQKVLTNLIGLPASLLPLCTLSVGVFWSVFIISAKVAQQRTVPLTTPPQTEMVVHYIYVQTARLFAKVILVILLLLFPHTFRDALNNLWPLPNRFYGYLLNARTGQPLSDIRIRIITNDGADLTKIQWPTDSRGFYIIEATRRVNRNATLEVYLEDCATKQVLPLTISYEVRIDPSGQSLPSALKPVFKHVVACGEKK